MSALRRFDPASFKILIVGDNAFERRVVMDLLIALGVRDIFIAEDGVAAFAQLLLKKPDMVIADAEMAPFSGFMLVREIRASPIAQRTAPIVLFSSETSPDFAEMAGAVGANAVLSKPVSPQALRACLEEVALRPHDFVKTKSYQGADRRRTYRPDTPRRRLEDQPGRWSMIALDRVVRGELLKAIDEARTLVTRWSETGESASLDAASLAVSRAGEAANDAGADAALGQALGGALRLIHAARSGASDPRLVEIALTAARAVVAAPPARNAMRHALADAITGAVAATGER